MLPRSGDIPDQNLKWYKTTFDRRHLTAGRLAAGHLTVRHLTPRRFYRGQLKAKKGKGAYLMGIPSLS